MVAVADTSVCGGIQSALVLDPIVDRFIYMEAFNNDKTDYECLMSSKFTAFMADRQIPEIKCRSVRCKKPHVPVRPVIVVDEGFKPPNAPKLNASEGGYYIPGTIAFIPILGLPGSENAAMWHMRNQQERLIGIFKKMFALFGSTSKCMTKATMTLELLNLD